MTTPDALVAIGSAALLSFSILMASWNVRDGQTKSDEAMKECAGLIADAIVFVGTEPDPLEKMELTDESAKVLRLHREGVTAFNTTPRKDREDAA